MLARRDSSDRVGSLMERFFSDAFGSPLPVRGNETASLPFDMYEIDSEVVIRAAVPGVHQDDVSLAVDHGRLTIRAKRDGHAVEEPVGSTAKSGLASMPGPSCCPAAFRATRQQPLTTTASSPSGFRRPIPPGPRRSRSGRVLRRNGATPRLGAASAAPNCHPGVAQGGLGPVGSAKPTRRGIVEGLTSPVEWHML